MKGNEPHNSVDLYIQSVTFSFCLARVELREAEAKVLL